MSVVPAGGSESSEKVDPKRRALGRGLEVLLPPRPAAASAASPQAAPSGAPFEIEIDKLDRNPYQTRTNFNVEKLEELARSIAVSGVVQPVVVRPLAGGRYQLIAGERRWLASQKAGKTTIPAIVRVVTDEQAMEMTIVENLQRADLNPIEQARAFHRLSTDFHLTQEHMAIRTGKDRASVANYLRLLRLPPSVQKYVEEGTLTMGHARALLSLPDPSMMGRSADYAVENAWSVRKMETYVYDVMHPEEYLERKQKATVVEDPNVHAAQERLQQALGMKVRIEDRNGRGRVIIEYSGLEDFDMLLSAFGDDAN